ncbi:MAG TPA: hypothetical protein VHD81_08735 [Mycobacteriales bacterium]|nr:hypothetical protein [Mycobacteriales bacterium]
MSGHTLKLLTIPLFTGIIGYVTNWSGVVMLFYPVHFRGIRLRPLAPFVGLLPRKIQQIPGIMQAGLGWQGIIPSRAAKMGSIAVDKGISKLGSPREFYEQLEPDKIAEQILVDSRQDVHDLIDRILQREHGQLWRDLPPRARQAIHDRVDQQLPNVVRQVTQEIGEHIDQLLDIKLMVIRRIEEQPELANRIFLDVGRKELKFIQNFGFVFGLLLGIPLAFFTNAFTGWWWLPIGGVLIGYATNLLGIWMIFEPVAPRRFLKMTFHGLFMRRQPEVADVYASIIANDIVTIANIGDDLMHGPRADRTRQLIENALRPAVDNSLGRASGLVRVAVGTKQYDAIRESLATEAVAYTMTPFNDPEFGARQNKAIFNLLAARMRTMAPHDFAEMLRTAIKEDEWLLYLHGAVLGFGAGLIHLAIFG